MLISFFGRQQGPELLSIVEDTLKETRENTQDNQSGSHQGPHSTQQLGKD